MPRWTQQEYNEYEARHKTQSPKPQRPICNEPVATVTGKEGNGQRFSVRITSYRVRLLDPDNLCGKYFVDCLRYSGIISDDTAEVVDYSIRQEKVRTKAEEATLIEVSVA